MEKVSKEDLEQRKKRLVETARSEVAKREVMHFRLDATTIEALYAIAEEHQKPVGTMVREWVTERLNQERGIEIEPSIADRLAEVEQRVRSLEKRRQ